MARNPNQPAEQIQPHASRPSAPGEGQALPPESRSVMRLPFIWKVVFIIWGAGFALLILYELTGWIAKLFTRS